MDSAVTNTAYSSTQGNLNDSTKFEAWRAASLIEADKYAY